MAMQIHLGLGSNLGNRALHLRTALSMLEPEIVVRKKSPIYHTEPMYMKEQARFLNMACEAATKLSAQDVLKKTKLIEKQMGRVDPTHNQPRLIDIDILFYGRECINEPGLIVPHPGIAERAFVLVPLSDIAPDFVHPILKSTIQGLRDNLGETTDVKKTPIIL